MSPPVLCSTGHCLRLIELRVHGEIARKLAGMTRRRGRDEGLQRQRKAESGYHADGVQVWYA